MKFKDFQGLFQALFYTFQGPSPQAAQDFPAQPWNGGKGGNIAPVTQQIAKFDCVYNHFYHCNIAALILIGWNPSPDR